MPSNKIKHHKNILMKYYQYAFIQYILCYSSATKYADSRVRHRKNSNNYPVIQARNPKKDAITTGTRKHVTTTNKTYSRYTPKTLTKNWKLLDFLCSCQRTGHEIWSNRDRAITLKSVEWNCFVGARQVTELPTLLLYHKQMCNPDRHFYIYAVTTTRFSCRWYTLFINNALTLIDLELENFWIDQLKNHIICIFFYHLCTN